MTAPPAQNFENHRSTDRSYIGAALVLLVALVLALVVAVRAPGLQSVITLMLILCTLVIQWRMRIYATRLQDRIIRLEMRLRLERALGADLAGRIGDLTLRQLVGLRFASDGELPGLVRKTLEENPAKSDEIKRQVKDWQADHLRV